MERIFIWYGLDGLNSLKFRLSPLRGCELVSKSQGVNAKVMIW